MKFDNRKPFGKFPLASAILLLIVTAVPQPAAADWWGGEDYYDYDGPCPPARPPILDKSVEELTQECIGQPCLDVLNGNADASAWTEWRCDWRASSCRDSAQEERDQAADDHMNAQIVCRTAPPPSLHEMCKAKNSCGQEIPLNGSCEWYCDNCYNMDPEGGLDPEKIQQDIEAALSDIQSTLTDMLAAAQDVLDTWEEVANIVEWGRDTAQLICQAREGLFGDQADLVECIEETLGEVAGACGVGGGILLEDLGSAANLLTNQLDGLGDMIDGIKGSFDPPKPPANSCDGIDWDDQGPIEAIVRAGCDSLDALSNLGNLNESLTNHMKSAAENGIKAIDCAMKNLDQLGAAVGLPPKKDNNRTKRMKERFKKNMKKASPPKGGSPFKGPLFQLKAACAIGKAGNRLIKCFGGPFGKGAKQVCEESHINCAPLLPPGTNRDDFLPRCGSTY